VIIKKIMTRIRDRKRRKLALQSSIVSVNEWIEKSSEYIYFFERNCRIPSPWGFLDAPTPWSTIPQIRDIFVDEHYRCEFDSAPKRILDCGGNIGLSTLYFTSKFDDVRVEVYEACPLLAATIQRNCETAKVANRVLVSANAVSARTGFLHFTSFGSDSGHVSSDGELIPCVDIAELIGEELDLLKMDIEGSEFECLERLAETGKLGIPKRIVVEIHLQNDDAEKLISIFNHLKHFGFKFAIRSELGVWTGKSINSSPFHCIGHNKSFIHLYAWR
jgi:FkbM family methyltransferase